MKKLRESLKSVQEVAREIFDQPTAPYRENWVMNAVKKELKRINVPFAVDSCGNVIAGVSKLSELKNSRRVGLMAHTDHPGFHIVKEEKKSLWKAHWFGGAPPKILGAKVAIHHPHFPEKKMRGIISSKKFSGPHKNEFLIRVQSQEHFQLNDTCFGAFDFPGFLLKGSTVHTKAADDLAGVAIILATFNRLKPNEKKNMIGIFTRAEEVGFRGALSIIYKKIIGNKNTIISLEASRQLEGARIGQGPVIRLGDKRTLFDSDVTSRLDYAAAELRKKNKKFQVQRRIMNGGTCEATPFNLHHIKASGIAIPLGNYHNQKANGRPGAEFIDMRDVEMAVDLCVEFFRNTSQKKDPVAEFLTKLSKDFKRDIGLLHRQVEFREREV